MDTAVETLSTKLLEENSISLGIANNGRTLSALETLADYVVDHLDDGHLQDIAMAWNEEVEEDNWSMDDVRASLEATITDFLSQGNFTSPGPFTLYRGLRVTCIPQDVRTTGTADAIGHHWSLSDSIKDPTFLDQYGAKEGRDVFITAQVNHKDINWLATLIARCNPWIIDYDEIVLKGNSVPQILFVSDSDVVPSAKR
jgi:hypothetical protein